MTQHPRAASAVFMESRDRRKLLRWASASRLVPLGLVTAVLVIAGLAAGAPSALAAAPTVTMDPGTTASYTTAEVSGTVDPEGGNPNGVVAWSFQYTSEPADPESWVASNVSNSIVPPELEGTSPIAVAGTIEGLQPGSHYFVRLVADDFLDPTAISAGPDPTFTTDPVAVPTVSLEPITVHTGSTAHFVGHINPNAPAGPVSPATQAAFKTGWSVVCSPACPGLSGMVDAASTSQEVSADATGLEPNTSYEVTLEAADAGGPASDGPQPFATDLITATVKAAPGASDGEGGYNLQGVVNPNNSLVSDCRFEYGLTPAPYEHALPCDRAPGAADKPVEVTAHPVGLLIGVEYHFRVSATNGRGPSSSGDQTFLPSLKAPDAGCPNEPIRLEQRSTFLPECRAFELVTNPFKEGFAPVSPVFNDEGVFAYQSTGNFAGNGLGGPFNQFIATRSDSGWTTTSPNPTGPTYAAVIGNGAGFLSADLRSSLWLMRRADEPAVAEDLYLREPDGTFTRIGPGNDPARRPPHPPGPFNTTAHPEVFDASTDLTHVLFSVAPEGVYPGRMPETYNFYEYVGTGNDQPLLVGVDNAGAEIPTCGNGPGNPPRMSNSGRVIAWSTSGCDEHVWARVDASTTFEVSRSRCDRDIGDPAGPCNAPAAPRLQGMSADGSQIYFTTAQQLLDTDTDETTDLYVCGIPPGIPTPIGLANPCPALNEVSGAAEGADVEGVATVSGDGSKVYFLAKGVLASNPDALGEVAVAGQHNLYVWERGDAHPEGQTTFVASLTSNDLAFPQTSSDGRYLAFQTASPLLATDTDDATDVYRYDSDTRQMLRISTSVSGTGGNLDGFNSEINSDGPAMSADGATIAFNTSEALSPADTNGGQDIYVWHEGHIAMITKSGASDAMVSGSGRDIFFSSSSQITANDGDTLTDFYDARIGGGFSSALPEPCREEACQPSTSAGASNPAPRIGSTATGGNVSPKRCRKGTVMRHRRCIKKRHKKPSKHVKRTANHNRRGAK
jgi:hypothetical protein